MFAEHPGRRVAVAVAAILLVALVVITAIAPDGLWLVISLKLLAGLGYMTPAIVIGGLTGWLTYSVPKWFWTTLFLMLLTATSAIYMRPPDYALWSVVAGGIYLCIPLIFYELRYRKDEAALVVPVLISEQGEAGDSEGAKRTAGKTAQSDWILLFILIVALAVSILIFR